MLDKSCFLTSNPISLKQQVLLGLRSLPFWRGPLERPCWGLRSGGGAGVQGEGWESPSPRHPGGRARRGEAGSGSGRAWDLRAPPRLGQPAWGWGVTVSSPRHRRRRRASIREVRGGFLLPAQSGRRSEAGSSPVPPRPRPRSPQRLHSRRLGARPARPGSVRGGLPGDQVGGRQVGLDGPRGAPPPARPPRARVGRLGVGGC